VNPADFETRSLTTARLGDITGFESGLDAFLHQRLRIVSLALAVIAGVVFVTALLLFGEEKAASEAVRAAAIEAGRDPRGLTPEQLEGTLVVLGAFLVGMAGLHLLLRGGKPGRFTMGAVDAVMTAISTVVCVAVYWIDYEAGATMVPAFLGFLLIVRAVVVPSPAWRTLLLCLPAAPAILAVQISEGHVYTFLAEPLPEGLYVVRIVWNQVFLLLCVGVAVLASRINFALRLKAHQSARLGQYTLEEKIGEGGMGEVYRARHAMLRRPTAIKLVRGDYLDEQALKRFEREVTLTAKLTHANTVEVFDFGRTETGIFYYAMELLEGADLRKIVAETGPLPPSRTIHVLVQALAALEEAHRLGLVHRDVKASNLFLCDKGLEHDVVKVMDFGLVKDLRAQDVDLTLTGEVLGTPQTISPEAIRGETVGPAADIYAIGTVGCFLLTGHHAFDAKTSAEFYACHLHDEPIAPSSRGFDVPADLERIFMQCLEKDIADRPVSADATRHALLGCEDAGLWTQQDAAAWWRAYRSGGFAPTPPEDTPTE